MIDIFDLAIVQNSGNAPCIKDYEQKYNCLLPRDLKMVLSENPGFYDSVNTAYRMLDSDEILDPMKHLDVDMIEKGLLPMFDIGNNGFLCYNTKTSKIVGFDISDDTEFLSADSLIELLEKPA